MSQTYLKLPGNNNLIFWLNFWIKTKFMYMYFWYIFDIKYLKKKMKLTFHYHHWRKKQNYFYSICNIYSGFGHLQTNNSWGACRMDLCTEEKEHPWLVDSGGVHWWKQTQVQTVTQVFSVWQNQKRFL